LIASPLIRRAYSTLLWLALLWAIGNCAYVYLMAPSRVYRIEAAVVILLVTLLPLGLTVRADASKAVAVSSRLAAVVVIAALASWTAIYLRLVTFPFLSDDYVFLEMYRRFADVGKSPFFFRPLFAVLFWILSAGSGASPIPFHVVGMALHLGCGWIVYRLGIRLFKANGPALLAAALFIVNPLQLEAALWISGLQELLWAFFVFAAVDVYTSHRELSAGRLLATGTLVACGLLSKETAVCYVLLIPAADWLFFRFHRGRRLLVAYAFLAAELAVYFAARARFRAPIEQSFFATPTRYFVKQLVTTPYRFFAHPWNTSAIDVPGVVLCAVAVALVALLFHAVRTRGVSPPLLAGAFVILATTMPVYSYFYVASDLISSRYIYCAAVGWSLIVAELVASVTGSPKAFAGVSVAVIAASAVSLHLNLRPWLVARDVVGVLSSAIVRDQAPAEALAAWQQATGVRLTLKDGVPYDYEGVGIFINGYDEFVEMTRRSETTPGVPGR
jgi:hypothetical protein